MAAAAAKRSGCDAAPRRIVGAAHRTMKRLVWAADLRSLRLLQRTLTVEPRSVGLNFLV
jgi:hypothetical protein